MSNLNYIKLFFTMLFAVTLAILISGTVFKYWFAYEANQMMEQATKSIEQAREEVDLETIIQHHIAEKKRIRIEAIENAQKAEQKRAEMAERVREVRTEQSQQENCIFWQNKYSQNKGSYEKQKMQDACE